MPSKAAKAKGAERKQRMNKSSLMEQILSKENLKAAYLQVVRNKGAAGVDGMTVEELGEYLLENGENIKEQLRRKKYRPQPVRRVEIPKPEGGVRKLGIPTVIDRFVQQAVAQVLTPIFEEQFHNHSYGFRPGRCAQQAVLKALEIWKHWKTPKNREKMLIKLGLNKRSAHGISYAKGYARVCRSWNICKCISNERLAKFGLISMLDYYTARCVTC